MESPPELIAAESFIEEQMSVLPIPGLAAAIVKDGRLVWSKGFGLADVENDVVMTDATLFNVASITKLVTNAAILQLAEMGSFDIDDDVNDYLPFELSNPNHPDVAITIRHLLTHNASLRDGAALDNSYACGDPAVSLADWIEGYYIPGGDFYDSDDTYFGHAPGERYLYSNLGYGVLGYLVEQLSGEPFTDYTRHNIFEPLGMSTSAWYIADINTTMHAVPSAYFLAGSPVFFPLVKGVQPGDIQGEDGYIGLCLYSYYNYPDGLMRSNVLELARLLLAHIGDGSLDGGRILQPETRDSIFTEQSDRGLLGGDSSQGLTWYSEELSDGSFPWGHSGGDPGVTTQMLFRLETGEGVIVLANRGNQDLLPIVEALFDAAAAL